MTTPYRDDTDTLEARHAALSEELSSVQAKTKELDELKSSEARLAKEVADVAKKLEGRATRRSLPLLERIQIASPCTAQWDEMIGDDRARFCTHCQKDVFNLSAMPREEAESFMHARTAEVCVRLYKRTDGTVLTSDCPVGVKRKRRFKAIVAVSGGLLAAGALLMMSVRSQRQTVMGEMTASPVMGGTGMAPELPPPPPAPVVDATPQHTMGAVGPQRPVTPPTPKKISSPASTGTLKKTTL
jgi:hypothetical protein